ncbi:MAG: prephenate dehydrogenase [Saprospiraceae bacterium]
MKIAVVGLGLIGGSIALDLRSQITVNVIGVDANKQHCNTAKNMGLVDCIMDLDSAIIASKVIILATPVDVIETLLPHILDNIGTDTIVMDVGSTKSDICIKVGNHKNRKQYVATHPLAGTEYSGPEAALKNLFNGAKNIICEKDKSSKKALQSVLDICHSLGMITNYMSPIEHDKHLAYVSHLSHVTSFALGLTVLDIEKDEKQIFNLASTGFRSTSRLAKSNPKTWAAIFGKNRKHLCAALDGYINTIQKFRKAISENNIPEMEKLMREANNIKRILIENNN